MATQIEQIKRLIPADTYFREHWLDNWRDHGNSVCPFHGDDNASLQVDGKVAYCHGCGKRWDVVDLAKEFHHTDSLKDAIQGLVDEYDLKLVPEDRPRKPRADKWITYPYVDEGGALLFEVVRKPDKNFVQRRPDPENEGQWIYNLTGTRVVLYRLPEVLQAETVWLVEGEKDVDNLRSLGITATTIPRGAKGWRSATERHKAHLALAGKRAIICGDNDGPGREFVKAAEKTLQAVAGSVVVLELPGLPDKGDVSDFIEQHGADEARRLLLEFQENPPKRTESNSEPNTTPAASITQFIAELATVQAPEARFVKIDQIVKLISQQPEIGWSFYLKELVRAAPEVDQKVLADQIRKLSKRDSNGDGGGKFNPLAIVDHIRNRWGIISFHNDLYRFNGRCHERVDPQQLDNFSMTLLGTKVRGYYLKEIREVLAASCYISPELVNPRTHLCLQNAIVRFGKDGFHVDDGAQKYFTVQIAVDYDPEAECPLWLETLDYILPKEEQRLVQQIFGYCLSPTKNRELGFIFHGEGQNGKSVVAEVLEGVVGSVNCSALSLKDLDSNFRTAELQHKMVNFSNEVEAKGLVNDERLKTIISGQAITVERKNRDPFVLKPKAALIVTANSLPKTSDTSSAWTRRWIIIPFNQRIPDSRKELGRGARIVREEISGVFNWAIAGYLDLMEEGQFTLPQSSHAAKDEYAAEIDHTIEFVEEELSAIGGPEDQEGDSLKTIYARYNSWAKDNGYKPKGKKALSKLLQKHLYRELKKKGGWFMPGVFVRPSEI